MTRRSFAATALEPHPDRIYDVVPQGSENADASWNRLVHPTGSETNARVLFNERIKMRLNERIKMRRYTCPTRRSAADKRIGEHPL
jgi:hypothetical protein